jgi:hypothetical protein
MGENTLKLCALIEYWNYTYEILYKDNYKYFYNLTAYK